MRRFRLVRHVDVSGVSGTGYVAEGVAFSDGRVALRWLPRPGFESATSIYMSIDDCVGIHGHGGSTVVEWIDPPNLPQRLTA